MNAMEEKLDNPSCLEILHEVFRAQFEVLWGGDVLDREISGIGLGTYDRNGAPTFWTPNGEKSGYWLAILPEDHSPVLEFLIPSLVRQGVGAVFLVGTTPSQYLPPTTLDLAKKTRLPIVFVSDSSAVESFTEVVSYFTANESADPELPTLLASNSAYLDDPQLLMDLFASRLGASLYLTSSKRDEPIFTSSRESALSAQNQPREVSEVFSSSNEVFHLEARWPYPPSRRSKARLNLYSKYATLCLRPWVLNRHEELVEDQVRKMDLLTALASVEDPTAQDLLAVQAHEYGWKTTAWHIAVWADISHPELAEPSLKLLRQTLHIDLGDSNWVLHGANEICFIFSLADESEIPFSDLYTAPEKLVPPRKHLSFLAISLPQFGTQGLGLAVLEARRLHRHAKANSAGSKVHIQSHKVDDPLLVHVLGGPLAFKQAQAKVRLLVDHPNTELFRTLDTYLQCESNLSETSQRLHIHRNTVSQRLQTVAKLLSFSFDDHKEKLALRCAFEILRSESHVAGKYDR